MTVRIIVGYQVSECISFTLVNTQQWPLQLWLALLLRQSN